MKCIKCGEKNICKANYCKTCGYHFTKEEQASAKEQTVIGRFEKIEKSWKRIKSIFTLEIITENKFFKLAVLLLIIGTGLFFQFRYGNHLRILESNRYQVQYNTKMKEYYLLTEEEETSLKLYKPNYIINIVIIHYDKENSKIEEIPYREQEVTTLKTNDKEDYYIVNAKTESKKEETIKLYVFRKGPENE